MSRMGGCCEGAELQKQKKGQEKEIGRLKIQIELDRPRKTV